MKITTERVGDSVLLTLENSRYDISTLLPVAMAAELAGNLLLQSSLITADGLELPESFRPGKRTA